MTVWGIRAGGSVKIREAQLNSSSSEEKKRFAASVSVCYEAKERSREDNSSGEKNGKTTKNNRVRRNRKCSLFFTFATAPPPSSGISVQTQKKTGLFTG